MTVVLALVGMLIVPTKIFVSLGAGAILVVLVAVDRSADAASGAPRPARRSVESLRGAVLRPPRPADDRAARAASGGGRGDR